MGRVVFGAFDVDVDVDVLDDIVRMMELGEQRGEGEK